jgi:mutator protein MutT
MYDHRVASIILINDGKVLLQHRDAGAPLMPNSWGFFGGHIDQGETPEDAVVREAKEELQIDVKPRLFKRHDYTGPHGRVERFVFVQETALTADELQPLQTEGDRLGFFTFDEARTLGLPERYWMVVQEIYDEIIAPKAPARAHQ